MNCPGHMVVRPECPISTTSGGRTGHVRLFCLLCFWVGLVVVATGTVQTTAWNSHPQSLHALAPVPGCALPLDTPMRAIHIAGNWGTNRRTVEAWNADSDEDLIPLDYIEYLQGLHVNWVGVSVALHYADSMDSTVERAYWECPGGC